ncbi:MAG TPA: SRPBCC domain-containing protein [Gemmatimonadaceae bacterium]
MKEYSTTAIIDASTDTVWAILTDAIGYKDWNPEIVGIDGRMALGQHITAHVRLASGVVRKVKLRVSAFDPPRRMEWMGGLPFGLFTGRRTFTVEPRANGAEFRMHLRMSGPLLSLILKSVGDRQPEVDRFSAALKDRARRL